MRGGTKDRCRRNGGERLEWNGKFDQKQTWSGFVEKAKARKGEEDSTKIYLAGKRESLLYSHISRSTAVTARSTKFLKFGVFSFKPSASSQTTTF